MTRIAFVFAGQSEVRPGVGAALYTGSSTFAAVVDRCSATVELVHGIGLSELLYGSGDPALLREARFAQPTLFTLQCALHAAWADWGLVPDAVAGHSLGEYAAACAAGVIGLDEAIALVLARGQLTQQRALDGRMVVAFTEVETVRTAIRAHGEPVAVAAVNAPRVVVVSGPHAGVDHVVARLEAAGIATSPLETTHAFHSACVNPLLAELEHAAARAAFDSPRIPFASALEGRLLVDGEIPGPIYWRRHAREPVRFLDAVRTLADAGCTRFLELGPAATLTRLGRHCLADRPTRWLPSLRYDRNESSVLLDSARALADAGHEVNVERIARELGCRLSDVKAR